jgi:hypothetical protein
MVVTKKRDYLNFATIAALALVILFSIPVDQAQSNTVLKPTDNFSIPSLNGNINFNVNGTYDEARLENGTWTFTNLQTNTSIASLQLRASVQDCNITITSFRRSNTTIASTSIRYLVEGQGKQVFKFSPLEKGGEWSITFNRSFIGENEGWTLSPDGTITVTKAPSGFNITLTYYFFPDTLGGNENNSNLSFYQKHSVMIATGVGVTITVVTAVVVTFISSRSQRNRAAKENLRQRPAIKLESSNQNFKEQQT